MNLTQCKKEARSDFLKAFGWDLAEITIQKDTQIINFCDTLIDRIHAHTLEEVRGIPAFKNLKEEQGRLDEDGVMIAVSRQALDELLAALTLL